MVPNVISRRVDFSMSQRVLTAMCDDIVDDVQKHVEAKHKRKVRRSKVRTEALARFHEELQDERQSLREAFDPQELPDA
jgi:hypothetical protein